MSRHLPTAVPPGASPAQPWNRQRLRSNNEWLLLELLRTGGPSSRAQLARDTGLSKPTVSAALAALEQAGLVREAGRFVPERGRTAVLYEPDPAAGHVLGVDIGRARLRVAVADLTGRIVARRDVPNKGRSANAVADAVVAAARETTAEAGLAAREIVHAVIGTPGVWDEERRGVRYATSLPGWGRRGLFDRIAAGLETAITVGNDANLAAHGEFTLGAGRGSRMFAYLLVGTGLGVGVVKDGELLSGAHGAAGEVGLVPLPVRPDGEPGGTLEQTAAADAVVRTALELGMRGPLTAKQVFEAARAGDPLAAEAVQRAAEQLAYAVAVLSAVLDPDLVVLGGGIGNSADLLLEPLERALHRLTPLRPRLAPSELGEEVVLLGAVATALDIARPEVFERRSALAG
ncbi:ROK family transcriptional regulator [Kitasatospora sp. CM 4170]|uniref:ROK family transcriptional regulator n=1 Tax=Kitasatospora aburaviensis TaxID=67265 RepID=A0ABW1EZ48_9ACTN|nr:ROK family transcriptional regulator [Kitasatospora sp. CM 4170]WNM49658.1 ROK family transcriptional regulator [Kitasatospora sp. CM 4170]